MGSALIYIVNAILTLAIWAVILQAILSWLVAFNVINLHNRFAYQVMMTLDRLVNPMLAPIRRIIPPLGGVDITPIVLLILLEAIKIGFNASLAPRLVFLN
jgi:YggT family protein